MNVDIGGYPTEDACLVVKLRGSASQGEIWMRRMDVGVTSWHLTGQISQAEYVE